MGNICGKTEDPDPFSQQGRVVGSAPPRAPRTVSVPKKVGGPARTLGGGGDGGGALNGDSARGHPDEARRRAAEAAEARAKASGKGGKLQAQLSAQKKQSRSNTLAEVSISETRARDADNAAKVRNWD